MKKIILSFSFVLVSLTTFAQDDAYKKDVLLLIQKTGADAQVKAARKQILQMIPQEKQAAFIIEFDTTLPSLYEKMAVVYSEVYTKEDIKAMLAFYETPAGKKMTEKAGEIYEKSQTAGQEWGQGLQSMMMKYMQ
jgi:uncharacterized protein